MKTQSLELLAPGELQAAIPQPQALTAEQPTSIMAVIARAAGDPAVDVAKMERLYAMLEKEHSRIAEQQYNQAMARAQAKLPMIVRDARNPQTGSMYAKLESICIAAAPTIEAEGFSLQFSEGEGPNPSKIRVLCKVGHAGGHSETFHVDLSPDDMGAKDNRSKTKIHGEGSTFTYGRRYLTTMIFNMTVIGADDDGTRGRRPKPAGPSTLAADPSVKELATELWKLLNTPGVDGKPIRGALPNWELSNQWLWREEILDGAVPETAPHLPAKRLREVIAKVKEKV